MKSSLAERLRAWVKAPDLGDAEANERLRVLQILATALLATALYRHLIRPFDGWHRYVPTLAIVVGVWLARRGSFRFATAVLPTSMFLVVFESAARGYGIHDLTLLGLPATLAVAGLLIGTSGPLYFGLLGAFGLAGLFWAEATGLIRTPWSAQLASSSLTVALLLLGLNAVALSLLIWRLDGSLRRSREQSAAMRQSEARWRSLVQDAPLTLLSVDRSSRITLTNLEAGPASRLIGRKVEELFAGEHRLAAVDVIQRCLAGGAMASFEAEMGTGAGDLWWYSIHVGPIRVGEEVLGATLICIDVMERRRARGERETLIRELGARNEELQRFTYAVSHDLRSPLVTIKGFLGSLLSAARSGEWQRAEQDAARVNAAADRMDRLLRELLELSRIGRLSHAKRRVPFAELVGEAVEIVAGRLGQGGVEVSVAADLPSVRCERPRIVQLLQNLIENAVKFMGDQSRPRIEIGIDRRGEETVFFVRDNGIGIEARHGERIFGMFERLDAAVDGTGIGLALARRIVETHAGRLWLESEGLGRGCTFCFTLGGEAETSPATARAT